AAARAGGGLRADRRPGRAQPVRPPPARRRRLAGLPSRLSRFRLCRRMAGMKQGNPFNPKVVYGLILLGIAAFAAIVWVMAYGGPQRQQQAEPELSRAQMLSPSAVGFKGLVQLVGRLRRAYTTSKSEEPDFDDLFVIAI